MSFADDLMWGNHPIERCILHCYDTGILLVLATELGADIHLS